METTLFIIFVAWSSFVLTTAAHHGRKPGRLQRTSRVIAVGGTALVVPILLLGSFGIPHGWPVYLLWIALRLGYVGVAATVGGSCIWLGADTVFVWRQRLRDFPFAFPVKSDDGEK